jgi:hypothetical protein
MQGSAASVQNVEITPCDFRKNVDPGCSAGHAPGRNDANANCSQRRTRARDPPGARPLVRPRSHELKCPLASRLPTVPWFARRILLKFDRLCGLVVRVPGYTTEMYYVSSEVRTDFIYVM